MRAAFPLLLAGLVLLAAGCGGSAGEPADAEPAAFSVGQTIAGFERSGLPLTVSTRAEPVCPPDVDSEHFKTYFVVRETLLVSLDLEKLPTPLAILEPSTGAASMGVTVYATAADAAAEGSVGRRTHPAVLGLPATTVWLLRRENVVVGCSECTAARVEQLQRALDAL